MSDFDIFPHSEAFPDGQQEDLRRSLSDLVQNFREKSPTVPLLFAICAPCQPFTTLARKQMTEHRQNKRSRDSGLLVEALEFVREFQPDYVLSENVSGITGEQFHGIWPAFVAGLRDCDYVAGSAVVDACNFGVPQYRKRSILIAARISTDHICEARTSELVVPTEAPRVQRKSVRDAISHLPRLKAGDQVTSVPNHKTRRLSPLNIKRISSSKPGE